jgi:hypothetical protein
VKHRELLVAQRTQAINALRGRATEFGIVAPKGEQNVPALLAMLAANPAIPTRISTANSKLWSTSYWRSTRPIRSADCLPRFPV